MEFIGKVGSCSFNDTAGASAGYMLKIPAYSQAPTDITATDYSGKNQSASTATPSNLPPATLWSVANRLHFINTAKGIWLDTASLLNGYSNSSGDSLLVFMRFKCAAPPSGLDTFFFGNATSGLDSFGLRVRQVGTPYPTGGDGQLVLAAYSETGGPDGSQTNVNICDNVEHSIGLVISRTNNKGYLFVDGELNRLFDLPERIKNGKFDAVSTFGIGGCSNGATMPSALACDLSDIHMVFTKNPCVTESRLIQIFRRLHVQPYTTITKDEWGY